MKDRCPSSSVKFKSNSQEVSGTEYNKAPSAPIEASEQGSASVNSINIWGAAQVDEICFV